MKFRVRKPRDSKEEKELHLFNLKLAEYCDDIVKDDNHLGVIEYGVNPSDGIEEAKLKEFISEYPYISHS